MKEPRLVRCRFVGGAAQVSSCCPPARWRRVRIPAQFADFHPSHTVIKCPFIPAGVTPPTCNGLPATCMGTDGDDLLLGSEDPDVIVALAGNDVVHGDVGTDTICGGPGNDSLFGARDSDTILGEEGDDWIFGAPGDDDLRGGPGYDVLWGGQDRTSCPGATVTATYACCKRRWARLTPVAKPSTPRQDMSTIRTRGRSPEARQVTDARAVSRERVLRRQCTGPFGVSAIGQRLGRG